MAEEIRSNNQAEEVEITKEQLSEQRQIRRDKLKSLQEAGRNPFLHETWDVTAHSMDIKDNFEAMEDQEVSVAGRIMAFRHMGKASFVDLQDKQGRIQIFVSKDAIGEEEYKWFKTYDIGDILGVTGVVFKTKTGEVSVRADQAVLLSKSIQVLPNKWQGLKDQDQRYRQRYVDLIINPDVKDVFVKRAKIIREFRRVLEEDFGYLEVDTPILVNIAGGANARPFNTHHNTLDIDMKLRISNELFLKRCIVGGLDRVYEMGKMFRNEGMDRRHNPEFTNMECYAAYQDMDFTMEVTEQMLYKAQMLINGTPIMKYQGKEFDITPPWRRLTMSDAIKEITGVDFDRIETDEEAREAAIKQGLKEEDVKDLPRGKILAEMFDAFVEDVPGYLDGPVFIVGHPVEVSPLSKRDPKDPRITRRFEAYINGWEIANAFSELNDPIDQFERFAEQQRQLDCGIDDEAHPMDTDFVNALEVGLPPTGGLGVGIDRCIMLILDQPSIRDIMLFPTMKPIDAPKKAEKQEEKGPAKVSSIARDAALELLKKYNKESFHIQHGLTVEGVMRWFANELGYGEEEDFWGLCGLLHDIDFEIYPDEHCKKAPELLAEAGVSEDMIHAICSHGYGLCCDVEPEHLMEKVLFASDELTGLIWSYALMKPEKTCVGMELKGLKKKFKDKKFAAGCSREVITQGAEMLGWELDELLEKTMKAMQSCEEKVAEEMK